MFPTGLKNIISGETCDPRPLLGGAGLSFNGSNSVDFNFSGIKYLTALDEFNNLTEQTLTNGIWTPLQGVYYSVKVWNNINDYTIQTASDYVTSGTFGFYKTDCSNGLTLLDSSGNSNDANINGADWVSINKYSYRDNLGYNDAFVSEVDFSETTSDNLWFTSMNGYVGVSAPSGVFVIDKNTINVPAGGNGLNISKTVRQLNRVILEVDSITVRVTGELLDGGAQIRNTTSGTIFMNQGLFDVTASLTQDRLYFRLNDGVNQRLRLDTIEVLNGQAYIPRDESNQDFDVLGNELQNKGKACNI